jgi:hypothetical protein
MMCENRIASEVRGLGLVKYANSTFAPGNGVIVKPERWRETVSFSFVDATNTRRYLFERNYEYCRSYWHNQAVLGTPTYYANYDYEHFLIVATPDTALNFELSYYERPLPLSDTNQTSWTTRYAPQLLLYGALLEAQPFLKLPERTPEFKAFYDQAAMAVAKESMRRASDQAQIRSES